MTFAEVPAQERNKSIFHVGAWKLISKAVPLLFAMSAIATPQCPGEKLPDPAKVQQLNGLDAIKHANLLAELTRAKKYCAEGKLDDAIGQIEIMYRRCPLPDLLAHKAYLQLSRSRQNRIQEASKTLDLIDSKKCTSAQLAEKLIVSGLVDVEAERFDQAWKKFESADQLTKGNDVAWSLGYATGWLILSQKLLLKDEAAMARDAASAAIKAIPQEPRAYILFGQSLQKLGDPDAAMKAYDRAIALNPDYSQGYFHRAALQLVLQKKLACKNDLCEARKRSPNHPIDEFDLEQWLLSLACPNFLQLQKSEQISKLTGPMILRPVPALLKASLLIEENRLTEAKALLEKPQWKEAELAPKQKRDLLMIKAQLWIKAGRLDEAERIVQEVESKFDRSIDFVINAEAPGWLYLADHCYHNGEFSKVLTYANRHLRLDPGCPKVYSLLGSSVARMGEYEKGIDYLSTGLKLNPMDSNLLKERAAIYCAQGKKSAAEADLARLQKLPGCEQWTLLGIESLSARYTTDLDFLRKQMEVTGNTFTAAELSKICNRLEQVQNPADRAALLLRKADLELLGGQFNNALSTADQYLKIGHDNYRIHAIKAAAFLHLKKTDEAKLERQRTIQLHSAERGRKPK